jgi:Zn-dependent protease with chaperone function
MSSSHSDQPGSAPGGEHLPERVRTSFPGLSSRAYEHPADRAALVALRSVPGFDGLLRTVAGVFSERRLRLLYLAAAVRTSDEQFGTLYRMHVDAARVLDLPFVPELFVAQDPVPNAMTLGIDRPFVVVTSGLLDLLDEDELRVVLGHELGHVLSGHALYSSVLFALLRMSRAAAWIPLGTVGLRVIVHGLKEWFRKAELSCDRAGLLVSQDPGAATRVHMKVAGGTRVGEMSLVAFLAQAEEYQSSGDARDGVIRILNLIDARHPFSVLRTLELKNWIESGDYQRVLSGTYPRRADDATASVSDEVKAAADSYREAFQRSADPLFKFLRDLGQGTSGAGGWVADKLRGAGNRGSRDGNGSDGA